MKHKTVVFFISILAFILMGSILKSYNPFAYPHYFPKPHIELEINSYATPKIELGRVLFYDTKLSKDNSISCASCHSPYNAFAHTDHDLSHGINDRIGFRNAPALFNLAWQTSFMWDGAINHLDMQALAPISSSKEMGGDLKKLVEKLQNTQLYPQLFYKAYQDSNITGEHLLKALSAFQLTLISAESIYDKVKQGNVQFTDQEKKGYQLFQQHCNRCHTEPLFTNLSFENNGLLIDSTLNDFGKYRITQNKSDSLKFKVPSLRNLSYSYPYMHDGRFQNLSDVINYYVSNKKNNLVSSEVKSIENLNANDKVDLISFLLTLNDSAFVFNKRFHFPKEILLSTKGKQ